MCTLMQKDVLIELIANTQATLSKRLHLPLNEDQKFLARLRGYIYKTSHDDLDYENISNQVKNIKNKYQNLPLL